MKKVLLGYVLFFSALFLFFFGRRLDLLRHEDNTKYLSETGVRYTAKVEGKQFSIYDHGSGWRPLYVTGVNIGAAKPGYFPGDFGITKADYLRWFQYISDMNANTIRVYVLQMPVFYQALKEFNELSERPLYLMHGVYLNESYVLEYQDAYAEGGLIRDSFLQDIRTIVDVIHGRAIVPRTKGNAGGVYATDISRYVTGWILGIEWEAEFVHGTNDNHPQITAYDGDYLYTVDATPFEVFLAEAADTAIAYEMEHYNEQRPLAMSNWVTSDPLSHPGEPNPEKEDSITVDAEKLVPKAGFEAGFFASYHVYPYYPDFFNYESKYLQDTPPNSYRAYLKELNEYHSMPLLISEVGIPASRGITHENIHSGYNQGHVSEAEQGEILVSLMEDIRQEGLMGALIFSWQDEWFKRSWNTMDLDIDERRPYWHDYQTSEQNFGLLAFDPGEKASVCYVDGDVSEWRAQDFVAENEGARLYMKSDEKFLYLMVETASFGERPLYIPLDVLPGQGNTHYAGNSLGMGADFLLRLDGKDSSALLVDPYYDVTYFAYGVQNEIIPRNPAYEQKDSGRFVPVTLMLNRAWYIPDTGETIPYSVFDTGALRYGIANPTLAGYDPLADFYYQDGAVEIRLPWLLLNISDPSGKQVIGDLYAHNAIVHEALDSISIGIYSADTAQTLSPGKYTWQPWEMPSYHERLKESYPILQSYFAGLGDAVRTPKTSFELFWARWNQAQFSNIGFWFPIQPVLNYALAFLLSVIVYFFLVLMYIHGGHALRTRRRNRLRRRIVEAANQEPSPAHGLRRPFSRDSLLIFSQLLEDDDANIRAQVRALMLSIGYEDYIAKKMRARDPEYLVLLMRLVSGLQLTSQADAVQQLLYKHPRSTDLQYQGLLTLSVLGAYSHLANIMLDEHFVQTLSFRSLQEICKAYTGDKVQLYRTMLRSPDAFLRRIAIKRIGAEGLLALADELPPYLDSDHFNMVIDAARSLGQLGSKQAAPQLQKLLHHAQWEVRAVAVTALARIDMPQYEQQLVQALSDPDWTVRSNAAVELSKLPHAASLLQDVAASGDQYAYEMLEYIMETQGIWGAQT